MSGFEDNYSTEVSPQIAYLATQPQPRMLLGFLAGLGAAILAAVIWTVITVITGYQIGWMAVGVGFLVGITLKIVGRGDTIVYGLIGAGLSLFGCLLGNLMTVCYCVGQEYHLSMFTVLYRIGITNIPSLLIETFSPMDILFYAIALYEGFKLSLPQAE